MKIQYELFQTNILISVRLFTGQYLHVGASNIFRHISQNDYYIHQ
jgi:hypothetical protein